MSTQSPTKLASKPSSSLSQMTLLKVAAGIFLFTFTALFSGISFQYNLFNVPPAQISHYRSLENYPIEEPTPYENWLAFESETKKIRFKYPPDWNLTDEKVTDNYSLEPKEIWVVSPAGSMFVHSSSVSTSSGVEGICNPEDPGGFESTTHLRCVFIEGEYLSFARYPDNDSWIITEALPGEAVYTSDPLSQFSYQSVDSSDLTTLDSIMKTVERF